MVGVIILQTCLSAEKPKKRSLNLWENWKAYCGQPMSLLLIKSSLSMTMWLISEKEWLANFMVFGAAEWLRKSSRETIIWENISNN